MRTEFCPVKTRRQAKKRMPWASVILKVEGGYRGYELVTDYQITKKQK